MDISNFIIWFINQFFTILGYVFNALDYITIAPGVTLFDFILTIFIITTLVSVIIASYDFLNRHVTASGRSNRKGR